MEKDTQKVKGNKGRYSNLKDTQVGAVQGSVAHEQAEIPDTKLSSVQDNHFVFCASKTKKLTTALYMVSDVLSDNEPLKWKIREAGLVLLKEVSVLCADGSLGAHATLQKKVSFNVAEIVSLLEVAVVARLISEMNFSLLQKEYSSFIRVLDKSETPSESAQQESLFPSQFFLEGKTTLSDKLFFDAHTAHMTHVDLSSDEHFLNRIPEESDKKEGEENIQNASFFQEGRDTTLEQDESKVESPYKRQIVSKSPSPIKGMSDYVLPKINQGRTSKGHISTSALSSNDVKQKRHEAIVKLLKEAKGEGVSIKDIAQSISGCSEKTVQRDLIALMKLDVLYKKGERRWSRYFLK